MNLQAAARRVHRVRPALWLAAVLAILWGVHLAATWRNGLALPDATREAVGASARTVWTRFHAHFVAPFFHDGVIHLAYNSVLLAVGVTLAVGALGPRSLGVAYLASPLAGILVDALLILPLAGAGVAYALEAAPARLVGASVVAFALLGMALAARAPTTLPVVLGTLAIVAYEVTLAWTGTTRPFVFAYHLGGFLLGLAAARWWP